MVCLYLTQRVTCILVFHAQCSSETVIVPHFVAIILQNSGCPLHKKKYRDLTDLTIMPLVLMFLHLIPRGRCNLEGPYPYGVIALQDTLKLT